MFPGTAFIARGCGNRDLKSLVSLNRVVVSQFQRPEAWNQNQQGRSAKIHPCIPGFWRPRHPTAYGDMPPVLAFIFMASFPCSRLIRTSATASKTLPKPKKVESETLSCLSKDLILKRARFGSSRWTSSLENTLHHALETHRGMGSVDWVRVNLHIVISYLIFHGYIISFTAHQSRSKTQSFP